MISLKRLKCGTQITWRYSRPNLFYYGFTESSVDLFTSHFKGRNKFVFISGNFSKDRLASYKVPKDPIGLLGPILFNLHKWPTIVNTVSVNIDVFLFCWWLCFGLKRSCFRRQNDLNILTDTLVIIKRLVCHKLFFFEYNKNSVTVQPL